MRELRERGEMSKNLKNKALSILAVSIIPFASFNLLNLKISLNNSTVSNNEMNYENSVSEYSLSTDGLHLSSNFLIDQYNSFDVLRNVENVSIQESSSRQGPNYIIGPRDVVTPNSNGKLSYISEEGLQLWESQVTIGGYGKRLVGGYYSNNTFYCLTQNILGNGEFTIYKINEQNGVTNGQSTNDFTPSNQWPDYFSLLIKEMHL